jgi:hypothetical protein
VIRFKTDENLPVEIAELKSPSCESAWGGRFPNGRSSLHRTAVPSLPAQSNSVVAEKPPTWYALVQKTTGADESTLVTREKRLFGLRTACPPPVEWQ